MNNVDDHVVDIEDAKSEVESQLGDTSEVSRRLSDLDIIHRGLCAKIEQLLKWGGAILLELDATMNYRKTVESQIEGLSCIIDRPSYGKLSNNIVPLNDMMRDAVTAAINATGGNKSEAARMLGKSRRALVRLSEKYGLPKGKRYTKKVRNRLSDEL